MEMLEAVEGFYIETIEGWYFAVKGMEHPGDRRIAVLRYAPDPDEGKRMKEGKRYRRLYGFDEQEAWIRRLCPRYLAYDPVFQTTLQSVPLERIRRTYNPKDRLQTLAGATRLDPLAEDAIDLMDVLQKESGAPMSAFGITGSLLIGMHTEHSDIDFCVFGAENCRKVSGALAGLLAEGGQKGLRRLDEKGMRELYSERSAEKSMRFEDFDAMEKRKANQGRFRNRTWFARFVRTRDEAECVYGERLYVPLGRSAIRAAVRSDREAIFTPCRYALAEVRGAGNPDLPLPEEIVSFRGRFCEQARLGDRIAASGLLEEVRGPEGKVRYQLLLGNYSEDTMVPLR
jgi:predicted nucleotidyltransferase